MPRKCIYTDKPAKLKDLVIPKPLLLEDEVHNWANKVPMSDLYKKVDSRLPTELELEAHKYFYLLELSRLHVLYYENKLKEIQDKINKKKTKRRQNKREKQEKIMYKELEIQQMQEKIDNILKERAKKFL
jgi:hypothetical protein